MTNKKILLISSNSSGRGGGERYLVYLTEGLKQIDCDVHVLLSDFNYMDNWAEILSAKGSVIHRRSLLGLRHRPFRFIQSIRDKKQQRRIAEICKDINPDGILVNQQYDEDGLDYIMGALMAKVAPVAGTIHMPMTRTKNQRPLGKLRGKFLEEWYNMNPYNIIFVSEGSQKEFHDYYDINYSTSIVNSGYIFPEMTNSNKLKKPEMWSDSIPIVGFIGQFSAQKNLRLLVDSWLKSLQKKQESYLLLVGDGEDRDSIKKRLLKQAPQDSWQITGWTNHPEDYLPLMDIYMMTSHFEGLPLALIEAVGKGLPAIVTNFNGATDVAKKAPWVRIVPDNQSESIALELQICLKGLSNLKQKAQNGRKEFQNYFSVQRMAEDVLAVLGLK
jgi:glycosyltransferase involved in cell wall biosynthesis